MHTALVQGLLRDRSAWELAHGYDGIPSELNPALLQSAIPAHI